MVWSRVWGGVVLLGAFCPPPARPADIEPLLTQELFAAPDQRLDLLYGDPQRAAPLAFVGMAREVASIVRQEHVSVRWRYGGVAVGASDPDATVVLVNTRHAAAAASAPVMAVTRRAGETRRGITVYVPSVADALGLDLRHQARWSRDEAAGFSVALGRVVAHELFHALIPDLPHTDWGLMAERLSRADLLGTRVYLTPEYRGSLRPALLRRTTPSP